MNRPIQLPFLVVLAVIFALLVTQTRGFANEPTTADLEQLVLAASHFAESLNKWRRQQEFLHSPPKPYLGDVYQAANHARIPPSLIASIIKCESNWNPLAVSPKGARGLMQVLPRTAREEFGMHPDTLWNPRANILAGAAYLRLMAMRFGGDPKKVVAAYNAGPTRLSQKRALPSETLQFLHCVRRWHGHYVTWLN